MSGVSEISLTLRQDGWHGTNKSKSVNCGSFTVDDNESDFVSEMFITKAAAVTTISEIRQTPKNQAWEKIQPKGSINRDSRKKQCKYYICGRTEPGFREKRAKK